MDLRAYPIEPGFYARTLGKALDEVIWFKRHIIWTYFDKNIFIKDFDEEVETVNLTLSNHPIEDSYYYNYEIDGPEKVSSYWLIIDSKF